MASLQRAVRVQADKLALEVDLIEPLLSEPITAETVRLYLSQAKRVRRETGTLVKLLAELRDSFEQPDGQ